MKYGWVYLLCYSSDTGWPSDHKYSTLNTIIHPHIWCLKFLCATCGQTDKKNSRLQPLSAASLFSLHLPPKAFVVNSGFKQFDSRACLLTFGNHSTASTTKGGSHCGKNLVICSWFLYTLVFILYTLHYLLEGIKLKTEAIPFPCILLNRGLKML